MLASVERAFIFLTACAHSYLQSVVERPGCRRNADIPECRHQVWFHQGS